MMGHTSEYEDNSQECQAYVKNMQRKCQEYAEEMPRKRQETQRNTWEMQQ